MIEDTEVDAMDDGVRPPSPVSGRPQAVLVPTGAFEEGAIAGKRREAELAFSGNQIAVQMFGRDFAVRAPFAHGGGVLGDAEAEHSGRVPHFD